MAVFEKTIHYQKLNNETILDWLSDNRIFVNQYAVMLLNNLSFNSNRDNLQIVITELSLADLNLHGEANYLDISDAISNFGFKHCPFIRLSYKDQIRSSPVSMNKHPEDAILIFSKPLVESVEFPKGFYIIERDGDLWLRGYVCSEDYTWSPDTRIIVCN